jgi:hypothetical protein
MKSRSFLVPIDPLAGHLIASDPCQGASGFRRRMRTMNHLVRTRRSDGCNTDYFIIICLFKYIYITIDIHIYIYINQGYCSLNKFNIDIDPMI